MRSFLYLLLFFVSTSFGQAPPALVEALTNTFPQSSTEDGRWVFYAEKAEIEKIEKKMAAHYLPHVSFYKVTMTNYLGYHVNQGTGVVLFDTVKSRVEFIEPLWYGDISEDLLKHVVRQSIDNRDDLHLFIDDIHDLMEVGSSCKFILTDYGDNDGDDDLLFDLVETHGHPVSDTQHYTEQDIWRQVKIRVRNNRILGYEYINPATGEVKP